MYSSTDAFDVVAPIVLLICIGKVLSYLGVVNDTFVKSANQLAYQVTLPVLLFTAISQADMMALINLPMLAAGIIGTMLCFALFLMVTGIWPVSHHKRGVIVQASFRANMGIVGLALAGSLLGAPGIAMASVYLGIIVPLFNFLAVWVLLLFSTQYRSQQQIMVEVIKSPLVIAVLLALPFAFFSIPLPQIAIDSGQLIGQITLPLALLCIGATLKFGNMHTRIRHLLFIVVAKCAIYPLIVLAIALALDVTGDAFVVLVLMSLAPTATASFPAAQVLGGDTELAADAIALTTVLSLPLYMLAISWIL